MARKSQKNTGSSKRIRTVREEPKFREQLELLVASHQRVDEVLGGVVFAIANDAESFDHVPGTLLSVAKTDPYPDIPALRIFFRYNDSEAHLICLEPMGEEIESNAFEDDEEDEE